MSKYKNVEDFVTRTKQNLVFYLEKKACDENEYDREVTQIINSFLGIIIIPYEENMTLAWRAPIPDDLKNKIEETPYGKNINTLGELCKELRNAISHSRFWTDIISENDEPIEKLTFQNYRDKRKEVKENKV